MRGDEKMNPKTYTACCIGIFILFLIALYKPWLGISLTLLIIFTFAYISMNEDAFKYKGDKVLYLGGYPHYITSSPVESYLNYDPEYLYFNSNNRNIKIPWHSITNTRVETKEGVTVARLLALGIFAFAFKKQTKFLIVEFKNTPMIFQDNNASSTIQKINSFLYSNRNKQTTC